MVVDLCEASGQCFCWWLIFVKQVVSVFGDD